MEERLFRAALACAFDWGLQPRPALKVIHHPAVAAMNGRSSTLTQALVLRARRNIQTEGNPGAAQVRGTPPLCPNVNARLCVEEQLFRADVEERLFRAVSASAFDCGLQPRPALKGIHPPAVAEPAPEKMASPPKDVSTGSPRSQGNNDAEWRSRSERLSCVGDSRPRLSSPVGGDRVQPRA